MPVDRTFRIGSYEREVCRRIAAVRRFLRIPQDVLATNSGVSRDQIANVETGRTILRFDVGWALCKALDADQWFVATGEEPMGPFLSIDISQGFWPPIDSSLSFLHVCCKWLEHDLRIARLALDRPPIAALLDFDPKTPRGSTAALRLLFHESIKTLTNHVQYYTELRDLVDRLLHSQLCPPARHDHQSAEVNQAGKPGVDMSQNLDIVGSEMSSETLWPSLVDEARELTNFTGGKAQLARDLGVSRQLVNKWLGKEGGRAGAELALRLRDWVVLNRKEKRNTPGGALIASEGDRPKIEPSSEKRRSSKSSRGER